MSKLGRQKIDKSQYLSWIEGPPPKRNAEGSSPFWDATNNAESLCLQGFSAFFMIFLLWSQYYSSYHLKGWLECKQIASLPPQIGVSPANQN